MDLKIAICDDEQIFLDEISRRIKNIEISTKVKYELKMFNSGQDLINEFQIDLYHIVLLDIDIPVIDGFKIAEELQRIKKDVVIIFITNHDDKVFQSYEYHPFWFLPKSHLDQLPVIFLKLVAWLETSHEKSYIYKLQAENGFFNIDPLKVVYFEAYGHYVKTYAQEGLEYDIYKIRCKISEVERQLSRFHFVRIQNGYVINCRFISKITSRYVFLKYKNTQLHINREKLDVVKAEFQKYLRSGRW